MREPVPPLSQFDPEKIEITAFSSIISSSPGPSGWTGVVDDGKNFHTRIDTIRIRVRVVTAMTAGLFMLMLLTESGLTGNWPCLLDSGINGVYFVQFCTDGGGVHCVESFDTHVLLGQDWLGFHIL